MRQDGVSLPKWGNARASGRTSNACGSRCRRALDFGLLLALCLSGCSGACGSERPAAIGASLAARHSGSPARHRLHSALRWAQSMQKAQPVEHHTVLVFGGDRSSRHSLSPSNSEPACWLRKHEWSSGSTSLCHSSSRWHSLFTGTTGVRLLAVNHH